MRTAVVFSYLIMLVVFLGVNGYAGNIQDDLIIHFSFDEIDGKTVTNSAGMDISGTLEAEAEQAVGYLGMGAAMNIDAGDTTPGEDFVRVSDVPEVNVSEQLTIAMWAKATNFGNYRTLMSKTDAGAYALTVEDGVPTAWVHVKGDYLHVLGSTELETDRWYHFALTFDGSDAVIYLDGEVEAKGTKEGNVTLCSADFMIGAEPSGKAVDPSYPAWHGILDEFYFYSRALIGEEIGLLIKAAPVEPVGRLITGWGSVKNRACKAGK